MELTVQVGVLLLLIGAVVAMLTRRLRLPYSVGLVAAGIILAILPFAPKVSLTKELIFTALLPPLLFEAAFYIHWEQLRRDFPVIVLLATLGVLVSACVTTIGMHYLARWQWVGALAFGVLIAATDPVSVFAALRRLHAPERLRVALEGESLVNDGVAVVLFVVALAVVQRRVFAPPEVIGLFLLLTIGGLAVGAVFGLVTRRFLASVPRPVRAGAAAVAPGAEGLATVMVPCHTRYRPPATVSAERNAGVPATRAPTPAATTVVIAA